MATSDTFSLVQRPSPISQLSEELRSKIAGYLDRAGLHNFGLMSRQCAASACHDRATFVRTRMNSTLMPSITAAKFLKRLIQDVQTGMPKGVERITTLVITKSMAQNAEGVIKDTAGDIGYLLGDLHLPNLQELKLRDLTLDAASLRKVLVMHQSSLTKLTMMDLIITTGEQQPVLSAAKVKLWMDLFNFIKSELRLTKLVFKNLAWEGTHYWGPHLEYGPMLWWPGQIYHCRGPHVNNQFTISRYGLDADGVQAIEAGVDVFLDNAKYIYGHPECNDSIPPERLKLS